MIRTANSVGCAVLIPPFYLFVKPPHTFYIRLARNPDWARSILKRGTILQTLRVRVRVGLFYAFACVVENHLPARWSCNSERPCAVY